MSFQLRRIYDPRTPRDGQRILVERLWPRGVRKQDAALDFWPKDIAPSTELRRWFDHDPDRWPEFRHRYFAELDANTELVGELLERGKRRRVTLLFSSREPRFNNAVALLDYLRDPSR